MDMKIIKMNGGSDDLFTDFNDISLQSTGAHLLFGDIDNDSVKETIEFIIKANRLFRRPEPLTIFMNTPGGSLSDGFALMITALYFVARGDGSSEFSNDLASHNRAVARYQKKGAP